MLFYARTYIPYFDVDIGASNWELKSGLDVLGIDIWNYNSNTLELDYN